MVNKLTTGQPSLLGEEWVSREGVMFLFVSLIEEFGFQRILAHPVNESTILFEPVQPHHSVRAPDTTGAHALQIKRESSPLGIDTIRSYKI